MDTSNSDATTEASSAFLELACTLEEYIQEYAPPLLPTIRSLRPPSTLRSARPWRSWRRWGLKSAASPTPPNSPTACGVTPSRFTRFMELPLEIRMMVYELDFKHREQWAKELHETWGDLTLDERCCQVRRSVWRWSWPNMVLRRDWHCPSYSNSPKYMPEISFTSREMRNEVAELMFAKAKIALHSGDMIEHLTRFLETLPMEAGFGSIHRLKFTRNAWNCDYNACCTSYRHRRISKPLHYATAAVAFMRRCPNLYEVHLTFHAAAMTQHNRYPGVPWTHLPFNELLNDYGLGDILKCTELRKVHLEGIRPHKQRNGSLEDPLRTLWYLGKWLKKYFEARGQVVEVKVSERRGFFGKKEFREEVLEAPRVDELETSDLSAVRRDELPHTYPSFYVGANGTL